MLQTLMFNVFCFFSPLDLAVNFVLAWPVVCSIRPASQHRMDLLRRALQTSQNSSTGAAVSMQGATGDVLETTLDKLTLAGSEDMRILLKSVYYEPYQIKTRDQSRDFTKLVGKVTDKDGNGMYYEVRGKDQQSCERQFQTLLSGKPFFVSRLKVQKKNPYYGHLYADFSERNSRTQFHAMASSHPSSMQMNQVFPVAKSDLSVLKRLGLDKKRVDIIGKVVAMKEQELPSHLKCDLYIKDESDKELRVQLWGETMVQKARTISLGEVVQVDNAILQRQVETGTIAATAEAGKDSKHGFCAWLHISPPGSRTEALQALTLERGEAISSAWAGSLSGGSSLRPTTGKSKAIVTCCSTAAACSIVAGESSDVVEIQLHGVWLAGVRGADVAYWPCKKCKTKVDQETGLCKKHSTHGCATEQEDNRTILATVHLADWTGQLDNLLVNEAALCELTGFKTAELLLQEVDRHGTVALCFRRRCDVRVATSPKHKQWSGSAAPQLTAATQLSLSASQTSPAEVRTSQQECQFEVVHAKPALIADFDESRRPCVPRILRLEAWFKMLFTFDMFRIFEFLGLGDACCSFCHLLTGPPHRRQHRAGVGLGRGLGIHGAWSGFHKSRHDVRACDHPCQDHG